MAQSYEDYVGDGTNDLFPVTMPYLDPTHIHVYVDGVEVTYSWINGSQLKTTNVPAVGAAVQVRRRTPREILTDFMDGSTLAEVDLDRVSQQVVYIAQESEDALGSTLVLDTDDRWEARNKAIKNVADPVAAQDAATKAFGEANWGGVAAASAQAAQAASEAAKVGAETARDLAETAQAAAEAAVPSFPLDTADIKDGAVTGPKIPDQTIKQNHIDPNIELGGPSVGPIRINPTVIAEDLTLQDKNGNPCNGMIAGPITIADGVTLTIPDGSTLTVV